MTVPAVDSNVLRALLSRGAEADDLDFKETVDLSTADGRTEMAKDVGAMASAGGYLIVGVNDSGAPVAPGASAQLIRELDPANLSPMLARWLPVSVRFTTAVHSVNGVNVALIGIESHPDGLVVMENDGEYEDRPGLKKVRFRRGQALIRRNTSSIVAQQVDVGAAFRRAREVAERGPVVDPVRLQPARGRGAGAFNLHRPAGPFSAHLENAGGAAAMIDWATLETPVGDFAGEMWEQNGIVSDSRPHETARVASGAGLIVQFQDENIATIDQNGPDVTLTIRYRHVDGTNPAEYRLRLLRDGESGGRPQWRADEEDTRRLE